MKWFSLVLMALLAPLALADGHKTLDWDTALSGAHRTEANIARNTARHPRETLEFFGLQGEMTVLEVSPGGGWYTEVLAPLLAPHGNLVAGHGAANGSAYGRRSLGGYLQKLGRDNDVYANVDVRVMQLPGKPMKAEDGAIDLALVFRNVHSWLRAGTAEASLANLYDVLAPGGTLGIVQHRGDEGITLDQMTRTAYVSESKVIALATAAGFVLDGRSEINANARDTKDYSGGVWTLPPNFREGDVDREKYAAIGESDRMTLRFKKPL